MDFCCKLDYMTTQFEFRPAMAEQELVALPPFKYFLAVIESLKAVRPLTPCSVKNV